ncbi:MAG: hypothetical protein GYB64_03770 [Chloroflexi bacterium]|nr:hypothetical protein [Chloroflexota bacterium]
MVEEHIVSGIWRYWLEDNSIIVYMIERIDDERAKAFSESVIRTMHEWSVLYPFKIVFNVSISGASMGYMMTTGRDLLNIGVTDDGYERVQHFMSTTPEFQAYLAVVLSKAISGQKARRMGMQGHRTLPQLEGATFFDMEDAVEWLRTRI